ncbi:histidine-tRNA ligase [Trifolium repens]|nr:histidine-tRNA ligase [Trifolium repens]
MARKSVKQVTHQDVKLVHNLIERCIQLYMTRKEIVTTLQNQAKIGPEFTEPIWQRLEEQNPDFFKAYYTRLALKQQIEEFNKLLEKQKQLMDLEQTKVASLPTSNGFQYHVVTSLPYPNATNIPTISENPACYYVSAQTAEVWNANNMQHGVESRLSNVFNNGGSSFGMVDMSAHGNIPTMPYGQNSNGRSSYSTIGMSVHENIPTMPYRQYSNGESSSSVVDVSARGDIPIMLYSQNSNFGLQQGSNGGMTVSEPAYSISPRIFGANGNVREADPNVGNASATLITGVESNSHSVNEAVSDLPNTSSNRSLSRILSLSNMANLDDLFFDIQNGYSEDPILDFNIDDFDLQDLPEIKEKGLNKCLE